MENSVSHQYMVVYGNYRNSDLRNEFIQGIGTYDNAEQAYGKAILFLNEMINEGSNEQISPIYPLEGDTGFGMSLKHETYTDYVYILIC